MQSTSAALPLLQGLVTVLALSTAPFVEADVSHVLRGEARPPSQHAATDPREVNSLTADVGDYWWMADDSPFRAAYDEYKKCSEKGNCANGGAKTIANGGPVGGSANANLLPIDIKKNPFFNGAIQINNLASSQGSNTGGSGNAFHSGAGIDISKNPFLNGEFVAGNGDKVRDQNGFIGVQPKKPGFATTHPLVSQKPGFATSPPVGQEAIILNGSSGFGNGSPGVGATASFSIAGGQAHPGGLQHSKQGPSQPAFGQAARFGGAAPVACTVKGHRCVPKQLCVDGVVTGNTDNLLLELYCNPETEVCCRLLTQGNINLDNVLPKLSRKTAHPTSINDLISSEKKFDSGSSIKFAGANGSSPITIQVIGGENDDGKTQYTSDSSIRASTLKPPREVNSNENSVFGSPIDYSNVKFDSNVRFASTLQGPDYLPPLIGPTPSISTYQPNIPTTPRPISCPPGTERTPTGRCENAGLPECPPGTIRKPDNSCEKPACPYGYEQQPDGSCKRLQPPTTPQPPRIPSCPPGTHSLGDGRCSSPSTPVSSCPPGTLRRPDGSCGPRTGPTPAPCPPGTHLTSLGECASDTQQSVCPFGSVRLPDGTCKDSSSPRPCPPGTFLTASGACASSSTPTTSASRCPPGTIQQPNGSCQRGTTPLPICPPGTFKGPSGECRTQPTPVPGCPIGTTRQSDGSCQRTCPPGSFPGPNGECNGPTTPSSTPGCPFGTIQQTDGSCQRPSSPSPNCPPGLFAGPNGECRKPTTPASVARCPVGTVQQLDGSCQRPPRPCPPGTYQGPTGECKRRTTPIPRCPFGTIQQPDGSCQKPSSPISTCPPGSLQGPNGECRTSSTPAPPPVCPIGTIQQTDGSCQRPTSPTSCPPNTYLGPFGSCEPARPITTTGPPAYEYPPPCPSGTVKTSSGTCEAPSSSPRPSCPPGTRSTPFGTCEPILSTTTPKPPPRPFERPTTPELNKDYLPPKPTTQYVPSITTHRPHETSTTTAHRTSFTSSTEHPPFSTPRPFTAGTKPFCRQGQILSSNGVCVYSQTAPNTPATLQCPTGTTLSPITNQCVKSPSGFTPDYEYQKPTTPLRPTASTPRQCGSGQILSSSGDCTYSSQTAKPACKPGEILSYSGECVYKKTIVPSTSKPSCPTGQVVSASGLGCEYPRLSNQPPQCLPGTKLNPFTKQCDKMPETSTGYKYPRPTISTKPQCHPGETLLSSGQCIPSSTSKPSCKAGQVLSASGECIYQASSTPRLPFGPLTDKPCPPDQVPSTSGFGCEYPRTALPSCPPGTRPSPFTKECVQAPSTPTDYDYQRPTPTTTTERPKPTVSPKTQCGAGQYLSPVGQCVSLSTPKTSCGPGQVLSASGACTYQTAATFRPTFSPPTSKSSCPPGQVLSTLGSGCEYPRSSSPAVSCPPGTRLSPFSNKCEKTPGLIPGYEYPKPSTPFTEQPRPTISPRPQCTPGQSLSPSGQCIFPSKPGTSITATPTSTPCPPGQVSSPSGYGCEYPKSPTTSPSCAPGTKFNRFTNQCDTASEVPTRYPKPTTPSRPQCGPGETQSPSGNCNPRKPYSPSSTPRPSCRVGQVLSASGECVYKTGSSPKPPFELTTPKPCPPDQVPDTSGFGCQYPRTPVSSCPPGTRPSPFTKECVQAPGTPNDYDYQRPTPTTATKRPKPTVPPKAQCGPGQYLSPTGQCITISISTPRPSCAPGQVLSVSGACVYQTAPTSKPTFEPPKSKPSCPPGQVLSTLGSGCEYPRSSSPAVSCPPGTRLSPFSNKCEKTPGLIPGYEYPKPSTPFTEQPRPTISPRPQCTPGQSLSPSGQCMFPSKPGTSITATPTSTPCPPGQVSSPSGYGCEYPKSPTTSPSCAPGTKFNRFTNQCDTASEVPTRYPKPTTPSRPQCGPGETQSPSGNCNPRKPHGPSSTPRPSCRVGQVLSASGKCIYTTSSSPKPPFELTTTKPCPPDQIPDTSGFGCEYPRTPVSSCPPGTRPSPFTKECVQAPGTPNDYDYQRPTPTTATKRPKPTVPPKAQCGPGQYLSPTGQCITISISTPRPSCAPGQVLSVSGACVYQTAPTSKPTFEPPKSKPSCPPGQVLSTLGSGCEYPRRSSPAVSCPPGTRLSPFSNKCEKTPGLIPGYEYPKPSTPFTEQPRPTISPRPQCTPGQSLSPSGQCIFPSKPGTSITATPTSTPCPPGQVSSPSGYGCEYPKSPTTSPSCAPGTKFNRFTNKCDTASEVPTRYPKPTTPSRPQCGPGETQSPSGNCNPRKPYSPSSTPRPSCRVGQVLSASGECVYKTGSSPKPPFELTTPKPCPPDQVPDTSGFGCEYPRTPVSSCPPGTRPSPFTKECVQAPSTPTDYDYQRPTPTTATKRPRPTVPPKVQCGPGQYLSPTGQCIAISISTPRPSCAPGQVLSVSGACVYQTAATSRPSFGTSTSQPTCAPGQVPSTSNRGCEYPRNTTPTPSCPPGTRLSSFNKCEKIPGPTPGYEYPKPSTPFTEQPRPTISPRPQCLPGQSVSPLGQCVFPSRPGTFTTGTPTSTYCPPGQVTSPSGYGCEYPTTPPSCGPGTKFNRFTHQCDIAPKASTGYEYPRPATPSEPQCGPGETLSPSGNCSPRKSYDQSPTPRPSCRLGQVLSDSGKCVFPASSSPKPQFEPTTAKPCPPGQVPTTSGFGCEYPRTSVSSCPPGTRLSPFTKECVQAPGTPTDYDYQRPTPTTATKRPRPTVPPKVQCGPGQYLSPAGQCVIISGSTPKTSCGPGQVLSASGACVYQAAPTSTPSFGPSTSQPTCAPGQVPSTSGRGCEYPRNTTPTPSCPPGTRLSSFNKCEKIPGPTPGYGYPKPSTPFTEEQRPTISPRPQCAPGQSVSPSGKCVYPSRPGTSITATPTSTPCPPGQVSSPSGYGCEYPKSPTTSPLCAPGTKFNRFTNQCDTASEVPTGYPKPATPSKPQCGPGETQSPSGNCNPRKPYSPSSTPRPSCRIGQVLSASGDCIYPTSSSPKQSFEPTTAKPCPPGQVPATSGFGCEYPRTPVLSCPPGTKLSPTTQTCQAPDTPSGYDYQKPTPNTATERPTVSPKIQCGAGQYLSPAGQCVTISVSTPKTACGPGQVLSDYGSCVYQTAPTSRPIFEPSTSRPFCPPGQILSASGDGCEYQKGPASAPSCPLGTTFSFISNKCEKKPNIPSGYKYPRPSTPFSEQTRPTVSPQCGPGQSLSPSGKCVTASKLPASRPNSCLPGQIPSTSGTGCEYPRGSTTSILRPNGSEYQKPTTFYPERSQPTLRPKCGPGESLSPSGQCVTPSVGNFKPSLPPTEYQYPKPTTPFGAEILHPTSTPRCSQGQVLSPSGHCVASSAEPHKPSQSISTLRPPLCEPGQIVSDSGICAYPARPSNSPNTICPAGQVPSHLGSGCEYPSRPTTYRPSLSTGYEYQKSPVTPEPCPPGQLPSTSGIGCENPRVSSSTHRPTGYDYKKPTTVSPQLTSKPQCAPGKSLSPFGQCVTPSSVTSRPSYRPSTPKPCPPGQVLSASGLGCEYTRGPSPPTPNSLFEISTPKSCPPGQILSSSGFGCEYPQALRPTTYRPSISPGYDYTRQTTISPERSNPKSSPLCAPGESLSPSGQCVTPSKATSSSTCRPGQVLTPSGDCVSRLATAGPAFGQSTPKPSGPSILFSSSTAKPCPQGQVPSSSGIRCEYPKIPVISTGYQYPKPTQQFQEQFKPTPSSRCGPGQTLSALGTCVYPSRSSTCSPGQTLSPSGKCIDITITTYKPSFGTSTPSCPTGQIPSASGVGCEYPQGPSQRPSQCPPGQILSSSGSCIPVSQKPCPPGKTRSSSGICIQTTLHPHTVNHFTTTSPKDRPTARPSGGYSYETPTPTFGYPSSPLDSDQNNINSQYASTTSSPKYTPRRPVEGPSEGPDNTVDSANANSFFIPTTRQPVTVPQQSYSRQPTFNGGQQPTEESSPPVGCAAALKCVQEIYCTADGFVSPVPVVLTKEQELFRVPATTCKDIETGIIGKCCRDPNYKDPWPSANLVNGVDDGQYKEDNFYGQKELTSNRLSRSSSLTGAPVVPPALRKSRTQDASNSGLKCGTRNLDSSPKGESPLHANFAEYPWQAMILRESNRSLLCGGVIIRDDAILTSAHCVEGLDTNDVLAKGGEWKLGIDEEPLPFEIVKVGAIIRHPEYKHGSYHNDVAILVLREKLRFTKNIGPLCLSQTKEISPNSKCKLTGWGKRILQLHAKGAIMNHIDVNVMDDQNCQKQLSEKFKDSLSNYSPDMICGQSNIDHCKVDYGSALACENDQGYYEFAGIYTWDTGCKQEGQIAGFVKPDTNWIQTTLKKPIRELKSLEREYLRQ